VVNLAVTELSERTMQVRCLVSARNSGEAFDLRCEVREKMVAFLQNELPHALPRERFDLRPAEA
jgi:GTPase Era involved in 16S rRNA processing